MTANTNTGITNTILGLQIEYWKYKCKSWDETFVSRQRNGDEVEDHGNMLFYLLTFEYLLHKIFHFVQTISIGNFFQFLVKFNGKLVT